MIVTTSQIKGSWVSGNSHYPFPITASFLHPEIDPSRWQLGTLYSYAHSMTKYFIFLLHSEEHFQRLGNFLLPCDKRNICVPSYFIHVFCPEQTGNCVLPGVWEHRGSAIHSDVSRGHLLLGHHMASVCPTVKSRGGGRKFSLLSGLRDFFYPSWV